MKKSRNLFKSKQALRIFWQTMIVLVFVVCFIAIFAAMRKPQTISSKAVNSCCTNPGGRGCDAFCTKDSDCYAGKSSECNPAEAQWVCDDDNNKCRNTLFCGSYCVQPTQSPDTEGLGCGQLVNASANPSTVKPGGSVAVRCDFGEKVNCIAPNSTVLNGCVYQRFEGNTAVFQCTAPSKTGIYKNLCKLFSTSSCPAPKTPCIATGGQLTVDPVGPSDCRLSGNDSPACNGKEVGYEFADGNKVGGIRDCKCKHTAAVNDNENCFCENLYPNCNTSQSCVENSNTGGASLCFHPTYKREMYCCPVGKVSNGQYCH